MQDHPPRRSAPDLRQVSRKQSHHARAGLPLLPPLPREGVVTAEVGQPTGRPQRKDSAPPARMSERVGAGHATLPSSSVVRYSGTPVMPSATDAGGRAKSTSLKNAVRRMFGKKVKEDDIGIGSQSLGHAYHRSSVSLPGPDSRQLLSAHMLTGGTQHSVFDPHRETQPFREEAIPQRRLSAPLHPVPSPDPHRARSPYALQFPQSARLKPLTLANPFHVPQAQELRRRATAPSVVLGDREAPARSPSASTDSLPPTLGVNSTVRARQAARTYRGNSGNEFRRRSRSAGELRREAGLSSELIGRRSQEIEYWRESYTAGAPRSRTSGPDTPTNAPRTHSSRPGIPASEREGGEDHTPPPNQPPHPLAVPTAQAGGGPSDSRPATGDTETLSTGDLSKELEDRVARLERGLRNFQSNLQRLTVQTNRKTVVLGRPAGPAPLFPSSSSPRASADRSPSMLADTLNPAPLPSPDAVTTAMMPLTPPRPVTSDRTALRRIRTLPSPLPSPDAVTATTMPQTPPRPVTPDRTALRRIRTPSSPLPSPDAATMPLRTPLWPVTPDRTPRRRIRTPPSPLPSPDAAATTTTMPRTPPQPVTPDRTALQRIRTPPSPPSRHARPPTTPPNPPRTTPAATPTTP
ncbi:hypothetical protein LTR66_012904, partial [Elasticomyces elasticus]